MVYASDPWVYAKSSLGLRQVILGFHSRAGLARQCECDNVNMDAEAQVWREEASPSAKLRAKKSSVMRSMVSGQEETQHLPVCAHEVDKPHMVRCCHRRPAFGLRKIGTVASLLPDDFIPASGQAESEARIDSTHIIGERLPSVSIRYEVMKMGWMASPADPACRSPARSRSSAGQSGSRKHEMRQPAHRPQRNCCSSRARRDRRMRREQSHNRFPGPRTVSIRSPAERAEAHSSA